MSWSPVEARAEEEIPYLNSPRRWEENGERGTEVKGDGRGDSTLDPFHYGNAPGWRDEGAGLQEMTALFSGRWGTWC